MKLGIDYGTSTTLVSYTKKIAQDSHTSLLDIGGDRIGYERSSIPSTLAITKNHTLSFGYDAQETIRVKGSGAVLLSSLKRCLACEEGSTPSSSSCANPLISPHCMGRQSLKVFGRTYSIKELITKFLSHLLNHNIIKPLLINKNIKSIGLSVPAMFSVNPRNTIYEILLIVIRDHGLDNNISIDVLNEPTAAITACYGSINNEPDGLYAVCDVGGGTTDIVVFEKNEDHLFLFKPFGMSIAGNDIDKILIDNLLANQKTSKDYLDSEFAEVRRAKEILTSKDKVTVFGNVLSKREFQIIIEPVIQKIVSALGSKIKDVFDSYKPYSETRKEFLFQKIFLSGGGSKIPYLKNMILSDVVLSAFSPDVGFISSHELDRLFLDDTPIVVVAYGASTPKGLFSDAIQHMLPYSIKAIVGDTPAEKARMYEALPIEFTVASTNGNSIEIIAVDSNNSDEIIHELNYDLVNNPMRPSEETLGHFLDLVNDMSRVTFNFKIDKFNQMIVTSNSFPGPMRRRMFKLPWSAGIEPALFDKYRRDWRSRNAIN